MLSGWTLNSPTDAAALRNHILLYKLELAKKRSTLAGTSVLSPFLHIGSVIALAAMIYKKSAVQLFERHLCLYILTFGFVAAKIKNQLVVAHVTKRTASGSNSPISDSPSVQRADASLSNCEGTASSTSGKSSQWELHWTAMTSEYDG
ncbi:hypothetical protein DUI87_19183 [Hirundo rustica rustica]|uniref:Uncharacterized protein n=1 Tax=Hirundo rustica rustica TaxID=333673 RepID=A0A3M0JYZ5_HIRRU|nr:hypothetical protein DUI87_19183 [Hirundo rustica rustica]